MRSLFEPLSVIHDACGLFHTARYRIFRSPDSVCVCNYRNVQAVSGYLVVFLGVLGIMFVTHYLLRISRIPFSAVVVALKLAHYPICRRNNNGKKTHNVLAPIMAPIAINHKQFIHPIVLIAALIGVIDVFQRLRHPLPVFAAHDIPGGWHGFVSILMSVDVRYIAYLADLRARHFRPTKKSGNPFG